MTCNQHLPWIQEKVDGTIGSIRRAQLDLHLNECADCRALLEDLQRIHDAAADLPALAPPDRAWLQIAGRLRQEGRIRDEAPAPVRNRAGRFTNRPYNVAWLAIAATLVIATAAATLLVMPRGAPAPATQIAGTAPAPGASDTPTIDAVKAVEDAQANFERAIAELEKVAKANQQVIDPGTSATIEKNLGILDQAIADNRAAVKSEPTSVAARETLYDALRQKVTLLQDTISLINEMRKGNNAAAAQLVNKS